jgi:kynureninase
VRTSLWGAPTSTSTRGPERRRSCTCGPISRRNCASRCVTAEAGIAAIAAKGAALTAFAIDLADSWLAEFGVRVATPRDPARRGAHVTLHHPAAWQVTQAAIAAGVVPDYRTPDRLRVGLAPLYTRFADVAEGFTRLRAILASRSYETFPAAPARVT